jgi:hypothetical protein
VNGQIHYVSACVLWLGLLVKFPDLLRHHRDPYLRSLCGVLALAGLCFFLAAEPTVAAVNRLSGVPNLAAALTYGSITAYGAASQVLIVHWRGGPYVHRTSRRWITAYACVLLGVAGAFALGDAPEERRTDFDLYYASTPFTAEMILLYLAGHLVAATVTTVSALRWAREVGGWLRAGLLLLGVGSVCNAGYSVAKLTAVAARWSGFSWPVLCTTIAPAAAGLAAVLTVVGVLIPLAGPRMDRQYRARRDFVRLAPLERELDEYLTRRALRLPRPRWSSPAARLMWRQTSIHNALGGLDAFFEPGLYERTREAASRAGGCPARAEATAWAAVIAAAVADERGRSGPSAAAASAGRLREGAPGTGTLVDIADALATSPLVVTARVRAGTTPTGTA